MRRTFFLPFAALSLLLATIAGCECSSPPPGRSCESRDDCRGNDLCIDGLCTPPSDSGGVDGSISDRDTGTPRTAMSVRVDPATAELVATSGAAAPTQTFTAYVRYDDGTEAVALGPSFAISNVSIGDLDVAGGVFTANGAIGGTATITATVPDPRGGADLVGTATLRVRLDLTIVPDTIADAPTRFGSATPVDDTAREAGVVYPLHEVVMPQNVYPADVQWTNGAGGDLFRVVMTKPDVTVTAYVAHDGMNHWPADAAAWRSVAQTNPDDPATLVVDRLEAASGQLVRGTARTMTFARAALTGSVYYWDIEAGRIQRIDDGSGTAVSFMPNPPQGCVGCHSVSPSGRYMAGRFGGGENFGSVMDLTTDLTPNPTPTLWPTNTRTWWFSSWSPDETRMVTAYRDDLPSRALQVVDPFTGNVVAVTGTLPTGTHPAWSPDGNSIAYVTNTNDWGGNYTAGDIAILPVTGPDTVGTGAVVHAGASIPGSTADSYPTWSPDSQRIAFANGGGTRSERDAAFLYVMSPDGSGVSQLARASSAMPIDYQPRFSPFVSGDPPQYYWLSFLSRRIYGNPQIGNTPRDPARRQQIWVTAIRVGAAPGEDPSAVPYWLPGQNPRSANISAFWAPRPCRPDGEGCSVGSECCGGDCRPPSGGGAPVCSPPPPDRCRTSGETCGSDADCCEGMGLSCLGHVCVAGPG